MVKHLAFHRRVKQDIFYLTSSTKTRLAITRCQMLPKTSRCKIHRWTCRKPPSHRTFRFLQMHIKKVLAHRGSWIRVAAIFAYVSKNDRKRWLWALPGRILTIANSKEANDSTIFWHVCFFCSFFSRICCNIYDITFI